MSRWDSSLHYGLELESTLESSSTSISIVSITSKFVCSFNFN